MFIFSIRPIVKLVPALARALQTSSAFEGGHPEVVSSLNRNTLHERLILLRQAQEKYALQIVKIS